MTSYEDIFDKLSPERQLRIKARADELREEQRLFHALVDSGMSEDDAEDVLALAGDWRKIGEYFGDAIQ